MNISIEIREYIASMEEEQDEREQKKHRIRKKYQRFKNIMAKNL